jgi:hypothetical protein
MLIIKKTLFSIFVMSLSVLPFSVANAYQLDQSSFTITITPSTDNTATTKDIQKAISYLSSRKDVDNLWTLKFDSQKYFLTQQISSSGLKNTLITSSDVTNPAELIKTSDWDSAKSGEYLLKLSMCNKVDIVSLAFYGQNDFSKSLDGVWPDQGVYIGSCNVVKLDNNKFYNFGNAALRVVTDTRDPVKGVNSFKTHVTHNSFNNFYQTATTSTDTIYGGTAQSTWDNNTFANVRGSIKFASRTPGAKQIEFLNNTINGGDHFGLEINNYSDFSIKGNTFKNIKDVAVNIYTGAADRVKTGFIWGDNFTVSNNTFQKCGRGVRYSHEAFPDGFNYTPQNLTIKDNTFEDLTDPKTPAIFIGNGKIEKVQMTNNKLSGIKNRSTVELGKEVKFTDTQKNTIDDAVLQFAIPSTKK